MNTIETYGYILKEEELKTLKEGVISNTFVIESLHPFPGYHGENLPHDVKIPEFIFFITKSTHSSEKIYRAAKKIGKYLNKTIYATKAVVNIYNKKYPCIRIKNCKDLSEIKEIQKSFQSEGFKFAKPQKVKLPGLIKIQKKFYVEETETGIYKDLDDANYSYFEIPGQLSWEQFRSVTTKVKNLLDDHTFDVALGVFFRHKGVTDIVRVYKEDLDLESIKLIKNKFCEEIKS